MHCLDAVIATHMGIDVNKYFKDTACWVNWDSTVVHGNRFAGCAQTPYKYIKWKDNIDALVMITADLKAAYKVRKELYLEPYKNVQRMFISWLRSFINKKQK